MSSGHHFVTNPGDGLDTHTAVGKFFTEVGDMHIHGPGLTEIIKAPCLLEKLLAGKDTPRLRDKGPQELKLLRP